MQYICCPFCLTIINPPTPEGVYDLPQTLGIHQKYLVHQMMVIKSLQKSLLQKHRRHLGPEEVKGRPVDLVCSMSLLRCVNMQRQHYGRTNERCDSSSRSRNKHVCHLSKSEVTKEVRQRRHMGDLPPMEEYTVGFHFISFLHITPIC